VPLEPGTLITKRDLWWDEGTAKCWQKPMSNYVGLRYLDSYSFHIRPDYPDPMRGAKAGEVWELIIAEDMPGDEKIPDGLEFYGSTKWLRYYPHDGITWSKTNNPYFRRRVTPVEPKTFSQEYASTNEAARAVASKVSEPVMIESYQNAMWLPVAMVIVLSWLVLGDVAMSKLRWKPKE